MLNFGKVLENQGESIWPQNQRCKKMCTAFPKHIYVSKLCMYIHDPNEKYAPNFKNK